MEPKTIVATALVIFVVVALVFLRIRRKKK